MDHNEYERAPQPAVRQLLRGKGLAAASADDLLAAIRRVKKQLVMEQLREEYLIQHKQSQ